MAERVHPREQWQTLPILANILAALRGDPRLEHCVAFDQMLQAPLLMGPLSDPTGFTQRPLTDADVSRFPEWLDTPAYPTSARM